MYDSDARSEIFSPKRIIVMRNASLALALLIAAAPLVGTAQQKQPNEVPTNLAGATTIAAPPQGFDPLTASDTDLAYYGFPPRPDQNIDAKGFASWSKAMAASKTRIVPTLQQTNLFHGPAKLKQGAATQEANTVDSYNWSGYVHNNGVKSYGKTSVYYIYSDYVVPVARQAFGACTGSWDYGSTWVGIDGYGSADVLQAGIEFDAFCSGGSTASYYSPWYEWYPFGEVRITNLPIAPGDDYFTEVWSTSATQGYAYLVNYNTNQAVEVGFTAPSGTRLVGNSAEWITERPGVNGGLATLTNYIGDPYWDAYAYTFGGTMYDPGNSTPVVMLDNSSNPISYPTLLGSHGFVMQDEGSAR
jgi:hypothetical protein